MVRIIKLKDKSQIQQEWLKDLQIQTEQKLLAKEREKYDSLAYQNPYFGSSVEREQPKNTITAFKAGRRPLNSINQFEKSYPQATLPVVKKISKVEEYYKRQRMLYSQDIDDGHSNSAPLQPHPPVNAVNPDQPRFIRKITDVMQLDDPSATQKQIALQEWKEGIRQQIAQKKEIDFQIKAREDFEDAQRMATKISSPTIKSIRKLEGSFSPVASPKLTLDDLQKAYYVDLGASKIPRPNHRKEPIKQDGVKLPEIVDGNKYVRGRLVKSIREPAKPRAVPKTAPSPKIESVKVGLGIKARAKTVVKEQTSSNHKHIQSITPKSIVKETYPTPVPERKRLVSNTKPKAVNTAPNSKPVHKDETITTSKPLNITKPVSDTTKKANVIHSPIQNQKTSIPEKTVHSPNPPQLPSDKPPLGKIDKPKSILHPTKNAHQRVVKDDGDHEMQVLEKEKIMGYLQSMQKILRFDNMVK